MNIKNEQFKDILLKYPEQDDKMLIAKIFDKIQFLTHRNEIQISNFLDERQQMIVENMLKSICISNYILDGAYDEAERKILLLFPEKLSNILENQKLKILNQQLDVISIELPNDLIGQYQHKNYLSAIIKIGIVREKVGDILVRENGADLIVKKEVSTYIKDEFSKLTRFQKANIEMKTIEELQQVEKKREIINILIPQLRLDCIITELLHISRSKANEIIDQERVSINYTVKTKSATIIKENDILTIRGKGKYKIGNIIGTSAKGKIRLQIEKYV